MCGQHCCEWTALSRVDSIVMDGQHMNQICSCSGQQCNSDRPGYFLKIKNSFFCEAGWIFLPTLPSSLCSALLPVSRPPPQNSHQSQSSTLNLTSVCTKIEKVGVPRSCLPLDHSSSECKQKPYLTTGTRRRDGAALTSDPGESTVCGQLISFRRTFSRRTGLPHYR